MALTIGRRGGLALVMASTLAWSTAGLFTRAIDADLPTVLVWRGLFGTLGMLVVLTVLRGTGGLRAFLHLGRWGWAYAITSTASLLAYLASLKLTSIAHVAIIYAMVPFMTAGLAYVVLGERPSRSAIIASTIAFLGALVMVGLGSDGTALGDALAVVMTFGMAVMMVIARKGEEIPAMQAGMLSTVLSILFALGMGGAGHVPPADQLWLLAGFGIANSTVGFSLFLLGSARIPAIETALIGALEAPIAPLWVWIVFGETPGFATLAGGAVVLTAVFWHILQQSRPGSAVPPG